MNTAETGFELFEHFNKIRPQIMHYPGIVAILALIKNAECCDDEKLREKYLSRCVFLLEKFPDEIEHMRYNFPSYTIGGNARAYAFFRGYMTDVKTKEYIKEYAEEAMNAPRDEKGIVKGPWQTSKDTLWIDNCSAITPFLLFSGLSLNEPRYVDEAVKQALLMYDEFLDRENGLLHQAKGFMAPGIITEDHWGRGNAWGYFALTELVRFLPKSHPQRKTVEEYFGRHSYALLKMQDECGLWHQELTDINSYAESSATAFFLYGFAYGMELDLLDKRCFEKAYRDGFAAMKKAFINEDFSTEGCCPGCLCPGDGKDRGTIKAYEAVMPVKDDWHSFGPLIMALSAANEFGIK